MRIRISSRNLEVTAEVRKYVQKKVGKLSRYFDETPTCQVTLAVERDRHIIEITMALNGMILRGQEAAGDMFSSIDLVTDKLERQIRKYKTRINRHMRKVALPEELLPAPEEEDQVVKVKRFAIKPMPVEEAVLQMNLLGHDFFVFANSDDERINVVYRRKDGAYGLIVPEWR
ncbi:MAG: ribosome-associated translation inhibitor RaiA [bacterium]|nr:ribosome-associated translation inhibitor RaiA [bacterium]